MNFEKKCREADRKAKATRKKANGSAKQATPPPKPPERPPVDPGPLAGLLDDVHAFIGRFVCYPSPAAHDAHTLWIVHTHCMAAWDTTPRIAFLSAEVESGKTRALEISELLVQNPVCSVNVSAAYLFRRVSDEPLPTILFDEIDTIFGEKAREHEEVRGLLNAGYRRGATAGRCVGPNQDPTDFPAYAALAMAGLGWLPDSLLSRAVVIRMRRRAGHETVTPYRRRVFAAEGVKLHDRLAAWGAAAEEEMAEAHPTFPAGIEDRKADIWESLLAIADAAGTHWPERARSAAVDITRAASEKEPSLGIRLLADLREIFKGHDNMFTKVILAALVALPESPWSDLRGKAINDRELATRLGAYGIKSKQVRVGEFTAKGYSRGDLNDAWERYLKEPPPRSQGWEGETSETSETAREDYAAESTEHDREADRTDFEAGEADNGNGSAGVSHVSHVSPLRAREGEAPPRGECDPVCAQCGAAEPGPLEPEGDVWLHPECRGFWFAEHPEATAAAPAPAAGYIIRVTDALTGNKLDLCHVGTNPGPVAEAVRRQRHKTGKGLAYSAVEIVEHPQPQNADGLDIPGFLQRH